LVVLFFEDGKLIGIINKEVKRQVFHVVLGTVLVALLYFDVLSFFGNLLLPLAPLPASARPLLVALIVGSILILLSRKCRRIPIMYWFLKEFGREEEIRAFPGKGSFFYILGAFVVVWLFERSIALSALMILALGDPVSHLIGVRMGRVRHPFSKTKFVEGQIAGTIVGALGAMIFVLPIKAFVAAAVAMFVGGIDVGLGTSKILDDNLIIPVTAGAVLFLTSPI